MMESRKNPPPHMASRSSARSDADVGRFLLQFDGRQGDDHHSRAGENAKRILSLAMVGSAKLEDLDGPVAPLCLQEIAEDDDVIRHKLLDAVASDITIFGGALGGEDRSHPIRFKAEATRNNSRRTVALSLNWVKMAPRESKETRVAFTRCTAYSMRASKAPKSKSPETRLS